MITIASALQRIRLLAGDMQKTKYSDYEIRAALDAGVDMLCDLLRKYASPELVRRTKLELTNGRVMLPEGFLGAVGAEDDNGCPLFANYEAKEIPRKHYRIEGDYLIAGEEKVNLVYHKRPIGADDIDLPAGMVNYLGKGCANLLNGEYDAATAAFENAVKLYGGDKRGAIDDLPMWGG